MADELFSRQALAPYAEQLAQEPLAQNAIPHSQDQPGVGVAPYAAAAGGQLADLMSTFHNFNRGYGESNGLVGEGKPYGKMAAMKGASALGSILLMKYLASHGQPGVAKALGYSVGAAGAIPAAINMAQPDIKK